MRGLGVPAESRGSRRWIRWIVAVLVVAALVVVIPRIAFLWERGPVHTWSPTESTDDPANSLRGQYRWFPADHPAGVPDGTPAVDAYQRLAWAELEPSPGSYDFSKIDTALKATQGTSSRFAFRVMAVCQACSAPTLPDYLRSASTSWQAPLPDGGSVVLPDWNDASFQAAWRRLMSELGTRYDQDPRVAFIDVGGYGNWGEGHNYPYAGAYPGPQGQREASVASYSTMVRAVTDAFPTARVVLAPPQLGDATGTTQQDPSWQALDQALTARRDLGLRNDCLGGGDVQAPALASLRKAQELSEAAARDPLDTPLGRWKAAPFVTEWCDNIAPSGGAADSGGGFGQGADQVPDLHVSLVSNGNFQGSYGDYASADQQAFVRASRAAGFRYRVPTVSALAEPSRDVALTIEWANDGSAPTYDVWNITYELVGRGGDVVAQADSRLDLREITKDSGPVQDTVTLRGTDDLRGTFEVRVLVRHKGGHLAPMSLVSGDRTQDGGHDLGDLRLAPTRSGP